MTSIHRLMLALTVAGTLAALSSPAGAQPGLTVTVASDRPAYAVGAPITFTLTVTNASGAPVQLSFPSGQRYDFAVTSATGAAEAWRWSRDRAFTQSFEMRTLAPGETLTFSEGWDQRNDAGSQVPTGVYAVTGVLTTQPRQAANRALFVIGEPQPAPGPGCFTATLEVSDGTPADLLAATFQPPGVLTSMWKREGNRWLGWAPIAAAPNDLRTLSFGDQVRFCLSGPATWLRPV